MKHWSLVSIASALFLLSPCVAAAQDAPERRVITSREGGRTLTAPVASESFTFSILGDRTSGVPEGLKVLERAVAEVNLIHPDLVFTVGDLVQGYTGSKKKWIQQAKAYRAVMGKLKAPWYPVAGNHDVYWRGKGKRPQRENEALYESHFGPLWYAFEHKGSWFIALFTDEGPEGGGKKSFKKPAAQTMSAEQLRWLAEVLERAKDARHVFLFQHHPRWTGRGYGDTWKPVHKLLKEAGNVSAVFAGHHHRMHFDGERDGISYFTLGATGGKLKRDHRSAGYLHHHNLVTVRGDRYSVATLPVGAVMDSRAILGPKELEGKKVVLKRERFTITREDERTLRYSLRLPKLGSGPVELHIGINHGADDTGDRGLDYRVEGPSGDVVKRGFTRSKDTFWVILDVKSSSQWTLVIEDLDTRLTGKTPGNGGTVEAFVKH